MFGMDKASGSSWTSTTVFDVRESLQRAKLLMMKQSPGVRVKKLWATKDAHDMLVEWINNRFGSPEGAKQSEPNGELKTIYGLAVTVFATRADMLMQAWQHDLSEVIAISTTDRGDLYQVDFTAGFDRLYK